MVEELSPDVFLGPRRSVGLGDEYIAVGKHVEPAGVVEASRKSGHARAIRGQGLGRRSRAASDRRYRGARHTLTLAAYRLQA